MKDVDVIRRFEKWLTSAPEITGCTIKAFIATLETECADTVEVDTTPTCDTCHNAAPWGRQEAYCRLNKKVMWKGDSCGIRQAWNLRMRR